MFLVGNYSLSKMFWTNPVHWIYSILDFVSQTDLKNKIGLMAWDMLRNASGKLQKWIKTT